MLDDQITAQRHEMSLGAEIFLISIAVLLGVFIALIGIFIIVRHNRQARLAKAKAYFESLENNDDDAAAEGNLQQDLLDADAEQHSDPNSFIS